MGGNATKHFGTERIELTTYEQTIHYLNNLIQQNIKENQLEGQFGFPLSYADKQEHGDIDLITSMSINEILAILDNDPNIIIHDDYIKNKKHKSGFLASQFCENVPVKIKTKEFETPLFQLDLIYHPEHNFDCAFHYYCFNDLGNMIGRIAYAEGLKFGQDGLTYEFPTEHKLHKELGKEAKIIISENYFEILDLLGFKTFENREDFYNHFKTKQDVFNYVLENKNFTPYAFLNTFKNSKAKIRDSKRKVLNDFVEILVNKGMVTEFEAYDATKEELPYERKDGLKTLKSYLRNGFKPKRSISVQLKRLEAMVFRKIYQKQYQNKFNGEKIIQILREQKNELISDNKKLGVFIALVKEKMEDYFKEEKLTMFDVIKLDDQIIIDKMKTIINDLNKPKIKLKP